MTFNILIKGFNMRNIIICIISFLIISCSDEPKKTIEVTKDIKQQKTNEVVQNKEKKLPIANVTIIEKKKEAPELAESLFNCDNYKLTKDELLNNAKARTLDIKRGKKVIRSLSVYCPSPYAYFEKSPRKTIEFSKNIPELEKFFCINTDDYNSSKYLRENEAAIRNCIDEFSSISEEHQTIKNEFNLNLKNDIQALAYDQDFDIKLGYNLFTKAKDKKITLYQSKFSFGGGDKINQWVTHDEYKKEDGSFTLNYFYGISDDGIVLKLVRKYAIKTSSANEALGICHQNRNTLFDKINYIKVPQFSTSNVVTYFSNKNIIDTECSDYGRTATLQISFSETPITLPNEQLINLFSTSKLLEKLNKNESENAKKYLLAEDKRLEHDALVEESNKVVESIVNTCPSPIDKLLKSPKHIYAVSNKINQLEKYIKHVNSKSVLNKMDRLTDSCIDELTRINKKWEVEVNRVKNEFESSLQNTSSQKHTLESIALNQPVTNNMVDLEGIEFSEGYWSKAYLRKNKSDSVNHKLVKLTLEESDSSLPIVKGVTLKLTKKFNVENCKVKLNSFYSRLKSQGYFLDPSFQSRTIRYNRGNPVYIAKNVMFNASCSYAEGEFIMKTIGSYQPDFTKVALSNLIK
jgi:hypothetical protein